MSKNLIFFILFSINGLADSSRYRTTLHEIFIGPEYLFSERVVSQFTLDKASGGFQIKGDPISARVLFGTRSLLYTPRWSVAPQESVVMLEGYGMLTSNVANYRAGKFRIPWGLEGSKSDGELWFPRTYLHGDGLFPLYDTGAMIEMDWEGVFFKFALHNGEGTSSLAFDNQLFFTGQWGWQGPAKSTMGISLFSGKVSTPITLYDGRYRGANGFFGFYFFGLGLQAEGSVIQQKINEGSSFSETANWHLDIEHPIIDQFDFLLRYEEYYQDLRVGAEVLSRVNFGMEVYSESKDSRLFLWLIKNMERRSEVANDEIRLSWHFNLDDDRKESR